MPAAERTMEWPALVYSRTTVLAEGRRFKRTAEHRDVRFRLPIHPCALLSLSKK